MKATLPVIATAPDLVLLLAAFPPVRRLAGLFGGLFPGTVAFPAELPYEKNIIITYL